MVSWEGEGESRERCGELGGGGGVERDTVSWEGEGESRERHG